ncbi:MAG: hypothetical protein ACRD6W_01275, partial [Nitrososphaerales archaeon]
DFGAASAPAASAVAATIFGSPAIVPPAENDVVNAEPPSASARSDWPPPNWSVVDDRRPAAPTPTPVAPSNHQNTIPDDLGIPDFLRR